MQKWSCPVTDPIGSLVCLAFPLWPGEGKCPQSLQTVGATEEWHPLPRLAPVLFSRAQGEPGDFLGRRLGGTGGLASGHLHGGGGV